MINNPEQFRILFFGSTQDSVIVCKKIHESLVGIITQPATPTGRHYVLTPTPVEIWAKTHGISVFTFSHREDKPWLFENDAEILPKVQKLQANLIVSASFGQKIPSELLQSMKHGAVNIHPSLLPRWRGADPVPWAMLAGDKNIGVTVVTLEEEFDKGKIIAQKNVTLPENLMPDEVRTELFTVGADILINVLESLNDEYFQGKQKDPKTSTYARKFTRMDGFIPWETLMTILNQSDTSTTRLIDLPIVKTLQKYNALPDNAQTLLERMVRCLFPWPGVWTVIKIQNDRNKTSVEKRVKILKSHLEKIIEHDNKLIIDIVQLEGKNPVSWSQFSESYLK